MLNLGGEGKRREACHVTSSWFCPFLQLSFSALLCSGGGLSRHDDKMAAGSPRITLSLIGNTSRKVPSLSQFSCVVTDNILIVKCICSVWSARVSWFCLVGRKDTRGTWMMVQMASPEVREDLSWEPEERWWGVRLGKWKYYVLWSYLLRWSGEVVGNRPRKGEQPCPEGRRSSLSTKTTTLLFMEFFAVYQTKTVLPSPPQSLITSLASSKAGGTSLFYRWGNWGCKMIRDLLKVTQVSCRAVTINQLSSIQN